MPWCDNKRSCHSLVNIIDTDALRVICIQCKQQFVLRKDLNKKVPEKRLYAKIFKKDILQPKDPLFYKYYPQYLQL